MSLQLWPAQRDDGSVTVAARYKLVDERGLARLSAIVDEWTTQAQEERRIDFGATLKRPPYVVEREQVTADVVFESRPASKRWKDWLVLFARYVEDHAPELRRVAFWDLVADRPNPASLLS